MDFSLRIRSLLYFRCNKKLKKKTATKQPNKKTKDERNFTNGGYLGVNNIETGLHSQKDIFLATTTGVISRTLFLRKFFFFNDYY